MSLELLAAGKLLEIALNAIVGDAASEGAKLLWQKIKNRLQTNQPIEAEIVELEQNPTQENLKQLEPFLHVEMRSDPKFAEEISKLGREIAQASGGDNITTGDIKAETGGVAAGKIDAPGSQFGGSYTTIIHNYEGKGEAQKDTQDSRSTGQANSQTTSTNLITLPPNLDNWVERKEEIEKIEAWLNNRQVTTVGITEAKTLGIQGLGGVGKSTLAAYFYDSLDFEAKFWADVSGKPDFKVFAEKIILALGGKVTPTNKNTELINNLLQLLNQRRCLLVVDNLETLLDEERNWQDKDYQQFFSLWLNNGTNSTLFITTQDKPTLFQGLQHWHTLGGMKIEEGIALLNKLAIQGTKAEFETFVKYVDGHPLTIKLVAGFLKEYCDSQLSRVEELELEQFDLAYQEAEGLHRSKQDARLSWVIQQHLARLNPEQAQFIKNLSVYRLPFNREAARYM